MDATNCNWGWKRMPDILTKKNGQCFLTADMNSTYNQKPLDEKSRRPKQFVIGNQKYEVNRLLHGNSIVPAAFSQS